VFFGRSGGVFKGEWGLSKELLPEILKSPFLIKRKISNHNHQ
jgi:hypothetical protein